jgi:hypothetical protein
MRSPTDKTSPIKNEPLRLPGQGLDTRLRDLALDDAVNYLLPPVILWGMAAGSAIQVLGRHSIQSWMFVVAALVASLWCALGFVRLVGLAKRLKLGRLGERHVGQMLQTLDLPGSRVFHDIPAGEFNLDHVVVCDRGVFVIETKTWSKRGSEPLEVKDGRILMRGRPVRGNPVGQAAGAARWLQEMLRAESGRAYECQPVVVIPGWFINRMDEATKAIAWVLEPKALLKWIPQEPERLKAEDVQRIEAAIARHVRSHMAGGFG